MKRGGQSQWSWLCPSAPSSASARVALLRCPIPYTGNSILAHGGKCGRRGLTIKQVPHLRDEIESHFNAQLRHG